MQKNRKAEKQVSSVKTNVTTRLDKMPITSWHIKILLILGGGLLLEGFTLSVAGAQLGTIGKLLNLSSLALLAITPAFLIGELVGATWLGHLADTHGRRLLFLVSMAIIIVGDTLIGVLFLVKGLNYPTLLFLRALTGFGVGGEFGASIAALQEFTPSRIRGFFTGTGNAVLYDFGTVLASVVVLVLLSFILPTTAVGISFLLGVSLAITLLIARFGLPESPRYLLSKGRVKEADSIVKSIEKHVKGKLPVTKTITLDFRGSEAGGYKRMFTKYWKRLILAWTLNFTETWPYYSAFSVFAVIFVKVFSFSPSKVAFVLLLLTAGGVLGVFVMSYLMDVVGRRPIITLSYGAAGILSIIIGLIVREIPFAVFIALLVLLYFFIYAAAGVLYPQIGEMFPTKNRGSAMGTAIGFGRLGGIIAPFALAAYVGTVAGLLPVFVITGVVILIGAVAEIILGPELKRKSLEESQLS
jgi:MFS family permease